MQEYEVALELDKSKENQRFNTFDALSVALCFVLVLGVTCIFFRSHTNQKKSFMAKNYVENLAHQIVMRPVNYSQDRMPASDQGLGIDPWGETYKQKIIKNSYGQPIYVVVLSSGPNNVLETKLAENVAVSQSQIENVQIMGDDVGYIKSFR